MALTSISVGIDPSLTASDALSWADGLASVTGATLHAIRSWQMPLIASLRPPLGMLPSEEFMARQTRVELDQVVDRSNTQIEVDRRIGKGASGPVLVEHSATSDLLVVGRTGSGRRHGVARVAEVVLGSTARYCVHHAACPVAAVPRHARWSDTAKVLVGIDGSASSIEALRWAVTNLPDSTEIEAILALPYWTDGLIALDTELYQHAQKAAAHELAGSISAAIGNDESLLASVTARVEPGTPRRVLTDAELGMDLVVVGDRGRTGVAARVLGSITDHVLRYAPCPVIVVHPGSTYD